MIWSSVGFGEAWASPDGCFVLGSASQVALGVERELPAVDTAQLALDVALEVTHELSYELEGRVRGAELPSAKPGA